jgi:hypothetical protein
MGVWILAGTLAALELVWNFFKLKINSLWFWINKNQGVYRDK